MAIPILPIVQAILGVGTLLQGGRAQGMSDEAIQRMLELSEEEMREVRELRKILSDPNNPVRKILMEQAYSGIEGQVTRGSQGMVSRLASMGWKSPDTIAGPLSAIAASGARAAGDVGRQSLVDFLNARIGLVGRGTQAAGGLLGGVAGITGQQATGAGESLGSLIALLTRKNQPVGINPYATGGSGGGTGGSFP